MQAKTILPIVGDGGSPRGAVVAVGVVTLILTFLIFLYPVDSPVSNWMAWWIDWPRAQAAAENRQWADCYQILKRHIASHLREPKVAFLFVEAGVYSRNEEEADKVLDQLLYMNPMDASANYWKGYILVHKQEFALAATYLARCAREIQGVQPEVHMYRGMALVSSGKVAQGCSAFHDHLERDQDPGRRNVSFEWLAQFCAGRAQ